MEEVLTILIADDNIYMKDMVALSIKNDARFEIIGVAENGEKEIELIKELKPNIVITDLKKGNEWSGLDIIKEIKDNNEYEPIFFIISASTHYYFQEIMKSGVRYILNKPCDNDRILEKLDDIYNDVYPKRIMILQDNQIETDNRNFFNKLLHTLKKRMS